MLHTERIGLHQSRCSIVQFLVRICNFTFELGDCSSLRRVSIRQLAEVVELRQATLLHKQLDLQRPVNDFGSNLLTEEIEVNSHDSCPFTSESSRNGIFLPKNLSSTNTNLIDVFLRTPKYIYIIYIGGICLFCVFY